MPLTVKPGQPLPIDLADAAPGTLAFGTPWTGKVVTNPPLPAVYWTGVYGDDADEWYDNPPNALQLDADGTGTFTLEFRRSGDIMVVMNTWPNPTVTFASEPVTILEPGATPAPTATPEPAAAVE